MISQNELENLYSHYHKEIFNYLYRLLGSYEAAEDILQDTFMKLIEYSINHTVFETTIKPFLYRTAHNLAINYLKKNEKLTSLEDDQQHCCNDTTLSNIIQSEIDKEIEYAVNQLDTLTRSIFILKRDTTYSNEEIAKLLHVSERTVRRKLQSATIKILSHLQEKGLYEKF